MNRETHREIVRLVIASLALIGGILLVCPSDPVQAVVNGPVTVLQAAALP